MDSDNSRLVLILDISIKMKRELHMTPETPTHSIMFGAVTSVFCFIFAKYSHPILAIGGFDLFLTRLVAVLGIFATLTTILSFYFKHEKRIDKWWDDLRNFFNRWF